MAAEDEQGKMPSAIGMFHRSSSMSTAMFPFDGDDDSRSGMEDSYAFSPMENLCCVLPMISSSATTKLLKLQNTGDETPILAASRHLLQPNGSISGKAVGDVILPQFQTFASAIPDETSRPALASIDGRTPITHSRIKQFVENEFGTQLHQMGFGKGDRIALVLPNGPELALAIVATAQWASCVPLSANGAVSELEADLQRCGATLVIGPYCGSAKFDGMNSGCQDAAFSCVDTPVFENATTPAANGFEVKSGDKCTKDWSKFRSIEKCAQKLGIPFCGIIPSPTEAGIFQLRPPKSFSVKNGDMSKLMPRQNRSTEPNAADDEVLVLFTSGTTGNKKLVPHCMGDMLIAAATIALSWGLTANDMNCNLMPLFHVGGIVRQVFSPIVSGGGVICCPSFDPFIFWALLEKKMFTWYYAAPTMHQLILETGRTNGFIHHKRKQLKLRMIANAAGGLLPSLAQEMMKAFDANVLPSYGMTECMPISSPPATYRLEKPGTSGVPVGPEVAILNTSTCEPLPPGEEGPVCVRGAPCFRGYAKLATEPSEMEAGDDFLPGGWFNTGDLGMMDEDGYLYMTGRSKEVINRGGEIISPMEVEDAVVGHPDVVACAAFSAPHSVLQEVVGLVLVMKDRRPRMDLSSLHEYLGDRLATPKWPQCLVFMDGLPKSHTNKLLRVKLGERLGLPKFTDEMATIERTFEAKCPPQGTPLEDPIPVAKVRVSDIEVEKTLQKALSLRSDQQLVVVPHQKRPGSVVCYLLNIERKKAIDLALRSLDRYAVPTHFVEIGQAIASKDELPPPRMNDAVAFLLQDKSIGPINPVTKKLQKLFGEILDLDYLPGPDSNFFLLGGSSMLASQLASKIRKMFGLTLNGSEVYHHPSPSELSQLIDQRGEGFTGLGLGTTVLASSDEEVEIIQDEAKNKGLVGGDHSYTSDHGAPFLSQRLPLHSSWFASLFQLAPALVVFPIWQVSRYLLFFGLLLACLEHVPSTSGRDIEAFVLSFVSFYIIWVTIIPLVFVAIKWIVIGRYKEGRYPIWGTYYLRWWFVDICRKIFLRGIWGSNDLLLSTYYRMLGAKIAKGARISRECHIAEYDLVHVGQGSCIEAGTFRGFGVDNGAMLLGPVQIGNEASMGVRSIVAPFTSIPDNAHLGPATSSYDIGKTLDARHARINRKCLPEPSLVMHLFVATPIMLFVHLFSQLPPLAVLLHMLYYKGEEGEFENINQLMEWLCEPSRIKYYLGIRVARAILSPFFYMAAAVIVKKVVIGKFKGGPRDASSQWQLLRHMISSSLLSRKRIQHVTDLIGRHYELVSILYRCLGAKVGKRVFWPGHLPLTSGELDLLEIGDDVVFGSRASIFFATTDSLEKVVLCSGSNLSDNSIMLPGSILGKGACLASNSVCPEGWYLPERSVWFGSKGCEPTCLEKGDEIDLAGHLMSSEVKPAQLQMTGDDSTMSPFGRAFYARQAPFFVWPLSCIVIFSFLLKTTIVVFHTLPLLGALHAAGAMLYGWSFEERTYDDANYGFVHIYFVSIWMFAGTHILRLIAWIVIEVLAKWLILGKRKTGPHNYDKSSYSQSWEIYMLTTKIRKLGRLNLLEFFSGTPYMADFFRLLGCKIGADCCIYPSGADPFMSEPDLVTIGDRCVIDRSSIVCHLNTKGQFELGNIQIENDCTLRARSRLQKSVHMEEGSQLLEKSVAMTGEVIESRSVWQGVPASLWFSYSEESVTSSEESL